MFEIGAALRAAREKQGLSFEQVEEATRLRARLLRALEEERFDLFPSDFYARSFLRGYADFLGLDGAVFAEEYRERFEQPDEAPVLAPARSRLPVGRRRALLAAAAVAAVVAAVLLAWAPGGGHRRPTAAAVVVPPPARHVAREPRKLAPAVRHAHRPAPAKPRIVLTAARGDCWLLVRAGSATARILYEGTLTTGRRLVFARRFLWFRAGAPSALDVLRNGRTVVLSGGAPVDVLVTPRA